MKVLIISRGYPSDNDKLNGIFEFDQAKALHAAGVDVAFISLDFRSLKKRRKYGVHSFEKEGIYIYDLSLPTGIYRRLLPLLRCLLWLMYKKVEKNFGKPDIIHTHFYFMGAIASNLSKQANVPLILTEHSSKLNKAKNQISSLDYKLACAAYKGSSKVLTVSSAIHDRLVQNFNVESDIVPNIIDSSIFNLPIPKNTKSSFNFVSVGTLKPIKGFDVLINAFADAELPSTVKLNIIGGGPEYKSLSDLIEKREMIDRVNLLGERSRKEIADIFAQSDAFILLSKSETFGLVYAEALLSGLPIIATNCGGPTDFVCSENGIIVGIDDRKSSVDAIHTMLSNADKYDKHKMREDCLKRFSEQAIAKHLLHQYSFIKE